MNKETLILKGGYYKRLAYCLFYVGLQFFVFRIVFLIILWSNKQKDDPKTFPVN